MILLIFFVISVILSISAMLSRNRIMTRMLTLGFALLLILFTVYTWFRLGETELTWFTYDSTAVLLLTVLAVLTLPTIYHGFIYTKDDSTKRYNIYHSGLIALMTFMAGAYLANTMT